MAQTWPVSRRRMGALKLLDFVGRVAASPFRRRRKQFPPIEKVLVIEPWNIGDVVLVTPLLFELRRRFPSTRISLLGRAYARDLLEGSGLVDEVIAADLPWTAQEHKYRITPAVARGMRTLVRELRRRRFDVTLDSRMDVRSNLLAAATGASRRVGYSIGGGGWLLTDYLPGDRDDSHKIDDWLALLSLVDPASSPPTGRIRPRLVIGDNERRNGEKQIAAVAGAERPTIGYHPGGSHPGKRWPPGQFRELMMQLQRTLGGRHVVFLGPDEMDVDEWPAGVAVVRASLREFMAQVSCCDVFVCNDSGPMHIADALAVPVVAIFEVGNPQWFGPSGSQSKVVGGELAGLRLSAAPLDHFPSRPIEVARVLSSVTQVLADRG